LLLAEHQGAQSAYVIYGPGGTPIYQINTTGEVQYFHQDHQGSTRLTTNANGTTRNTISYNAHGEITANTNWWLEQPLAGYTGQYHDPETGYIYLIARHYDPATGQFTSVDPLVTVTEEPYGYVGGNPLNRTDLSGLAFWTDICIRGINCGEGATTVFVSPQDAANFAAGVLNGLTLGHGKGVTDRLPGEADYNSGWAITGTIVGTAPWVAGSVGSGPAWKDASFTGSQITGNATLASAVMNIWNACRAGEWTADCAWTFLTNTGTAALGAFGSIASSRGAALFSVFANYLPPRVVREFVESPAAADAHC